MVDYFDYLCDLMCGEPEDIDEEAFVALNTDIKSRDEIIFSDGYVKDKYYPGGIRKYTGLNVDKLRMLIDQNFADEDERQNECPSIGEIYKFMQKHPSFTAHGYTVDIARDDYRVSIEGVDKGGEMTVEEFHDFVILFRCADEFDIERGFCWYD